MKKTHIYLVAILLSVSIFNLSCGNQQTELKSVEDNLPAVNETEVLHNFLKLTGDFINHPSIPTMIAADELFSQINNPKYFVIDMRTKDLYEQGHIEGAVNVEQTAIYDFITKDFNAANYDKVVIVCKSGQSASYVTSVFQLLGYKNVYSLKRGMSSWNRTYAEDVWIKNATGSFADKLETTPNEKAKASEFPVLKTGKRTGIDILEVRAKEALALTANEWGVKANEVFETPANFYIVNYWTEDLYNVGHIPTAVQYTPKVSLSAKAELKTIPNDKKVAVYCFTGQHAAFVVAYLRILGYDAYSILYGSNGFMNTKMAEGGVIGHAFTTAEVMNYPSIVGPNPTDKVQTSESSETKVEDVTTKVVVKKKTASSGGGGGC